MKIITWNCNMAFRKKAKYILEHDPDIIVVPECERLERLTFAAGIPTPTDSLWFGTNPNKGLGIFSYSDFHFALNKNYNPAFKHVIPLTVRSNSSRFSLLAIWANNPGDADGQYVEQVWKAIHYYKNIIRRQKTVLIGDFNSNTIWDKPRRIGNHSDLVQQLRKKGIESAYHLHHKQKEGREKHSTLFLYRHKNKPYHIDYCFTSADLSRRIKSVEIGDHQYWTQWSDHVPLIVSIEGFP